MALYLLRLLIGILLLVSVAGPAIAQDQVRFQLISHQQIRNFPSASTILFHNDQLFITGDDSRDIMILDTQHRKLDSIRVFEGRKSRIPRREKADIESSFLSAGMKKRIVLNGSGSSPKRYKSFLIPLDKKRRGRISALENGEWLKRLDQSLRPINIEGATTVGRNLVLGNRRQSGGRENFLLIMNRKSFLGEEVKDPRIMNVSFPDSVSAWAGISDLCYVGSLDMLLITFSSERSADPTEDGEIGDSYIGWISGFRTKQAQPDLRIDGLIDLTAASPAFRLQKIEGICVEKSSGKELILHLVSDNDDGKSQIFRANLSFY